MKCLAILFAICFLLNALGAMESGNTNNVSPKTNLFKTFGDYYDSLSANELERLRAKYPFFDGMPPDLPEDDKRRTDEWEGEVYTIMKRDASGEWVELSKEEITRNRFKAGPYWHDGRNFTTLGQLAQLCDGAFIGEIVKLEFKSPEAQAEINRRIFSEVRVSFRVITNLYGNISGGKVTIPMMWSEEYVPSVGMKLIFFYTRGYKRIIWDGNMVTFNLWEKHPAVPDSPPGTMLDRGFHTRLLDTPERERAFTEAAIGYLRLLRVEKRDPVKYYEFLRPLLKSPILRIREDARNDMRALFGRDGAESLNLSNLMEDPQLMEAFRDYIRYIAIPAQERRQAEAQKKQ